MDTKKQRQHRRDNARLTDSRNTRSEQLLVIPTESLTNRKWLPRELLLVLLKLRTPYGM